MPIRVKSPSTNQSPPRGQTSIVLTLFIPLPSSLSPHRFEFELVFTAMAAAAKKSHPTYLEMIGEAIGSLKERTGSSQYAIAKFIEDKHKAKLPSNFKKLLLVQLKKLTAGGKLTKIKNSYRLSSVPKKTAAAPAKAAATKAKSPVKKAAKPKRAVKTSATASPAPKRKAAAMAAKPKVKSVKKVGKSPARKAPAAKKAKK